MHVPSFPTALRTVLLVVSLGVKSAAAEPEPTPEARAHFRAGLEHLDANRNAEAYREFKAAYAISPKAKVLVNIGIVAERLERDGEAIDAYQSYHDREALNVREAGPVRRSLERLRGRIATVTLEAPGTFSVIDTRAGAVGAVVNQYGPFTGRAELRVHAGQHEFRVDRASIQVPAWSVTLLAGDVATHAFESEIAVLEAFEPAPPVAVADEPERDAPAPSYTASYVLWGTGGLGAIGTVAVLLHAKSAQAASWRTAGLLTGAGALGALATGTVLYFWNSGGSNEGEHASASVQPWVSPAGIGISGTF